MEGKQLNFEVIKEKQDEICDPETWLDDMKLRNIFSTCLTNKSVPNCRSKNVDIQLMLGTLKKEKIEKQKLLFNIDDRERRIRFKRVKS